MLETTCSFLKNKIDANIKTIFELFNCCQTDSANYDILVPEVALDFLIVVLVGGNEKICHNEILCVIVVLFFF